jgi:hypothetical protein
VIKMNRSVALKTLLLMAFLLIGLTSVVSAAALSVTTDQASYAQGGAVAISGAGTADAWVALEVSNPLGGRIYLDTVQVATAETYSSTFTLPGDAMTGTYTVSASAAGETASTTFTVTGVVPPVTGVIDVAVEVASLYFPGEDAYIYVLTAKDGRPTNATVAGTLHIGPGTLVSSLTLTYVSEGLYMATATVDAAGSYLVVVDATMGANYGSAIKSFEVSPTLVAWQDVILAMSDDIAVIKTDSGVLLGKVTGIEGTVATIQTDQGTFTADIAAAKAAVEGLTVPLYAAVVLALIAAIAAVISVVQLSRKLAG